jgi:3-methylcrotonyl-CoA carboxylase beta subunit
MGGPQAADTLATVRRNQIERSGQDWSADDEETFKKPIRDQFERQSDAYYSTARLWDDGIIDPADTRDLLGLALETCRYAPLTDPRYGVFRM